MDNNAEEYSKTLLCMPKDVYRFVEVNFVLIKHLTTNLKMSINVKMTVQPGTLKEQMFVFPHSFVTPLATPVKPITMQPSV